MNRLLFGFCMSMFFWQFGTFMMFTLRGTNEAAAIFWDRFVYIGVVFMPSFMQHFSLVFIKNKGQRGLLVLNYILSFFFLAFTQSDLFVSGLNIYSWGAHSKAQLLHHIFLFYFFLGTGIFFFNLFRYYLRQKDFQTRLQTIYVFVAFAIVIFVGGSAYLYAYGIDTHFPFAYFSGVVFPVMLFYAVSRHHLLGVKTVGTEILVGVSVFILVVDMLLAKSTLEIFIRGLFALSIAAMGGLLIRSVYDEIHRREEVAHLAESLEKANARLSELDRQKTEFLSIASHQLRTPLSILKGYIELIEDGAYEKPSRKLCKVLANMNESNERLVKLVDEFLDITRIEQGRTKYAFDVKDLNELISSVVKELNDRAEKNGTKIAWIQKTKKEKVFMDEEKIRHVVFNYVDNAIKYSERGTIRIRVEKGLRGGVVVRVTDQGLGFNKEDEPNFFNKFYRGKNVEGVNVTGTGLGIYVCRQFVEGHGGRVWAKSAGLGKGSEFGFSIPKKKTKVHIKMQAIGKDKETQQIVNQYVAHRMP